MRRLSCLCVLLLSGISLTGIQSQDIFDAEVMEVDIRFHRADWREVLLNARKSGDNRRLAAVVRIDDETYPHVQVRFKGNSSFFGALKAGYKKIPFHLKLEGDSVFAGGYETLKLSNNFRDPSAVRERLAYDIAGTYVPVPKCNYAVVTVNGEYLGVYTATEGITREMISRFFCDRKRSLIQCEPDFQAPVPKDCPKGSYSSLIYLGADPKCYERFYEVKDPAHWDNLIRLMRVLQDSAEIVEEVLDIHLALWMHAVNNVLANLDSYLGYFCHNYYLFLDESGIFHPLLWDLNLAFGNFHVLKAGVDVDLVRLSPMVHERYHLENRPLITELLENPLYREIYFGMIRTMLTDWFLNDRYLKRAHELQDLIRDAVQAEENTFFSYDDFRRNLTLDFKPEDGTRSVYGIESFMRERVAYLDAHPFLQDSFLEVVEWEVIERMDQSIIMEISASESVENVRLWIRETDCAAFRAVVAEPNSGNQFRVSIPENIHSFYFELSGEGTANLWPHQAPGKVIRLDDAE